MNKLLFIVLIFYSLGATAQGTYAINGTVRDEKGATIPGATVFITNSKYIQSTNGEGKFSFSSLGSGTYQVVVKLIGFEPGVKDITVSNEPVNIAVVLKESNTILNSVTINSKPDPNREKYLAWFIKDFIGETVNSRQCKLANSDVIRFHFDKDRNDLTATAADFIIIENKALGYKIKYLLHDFEIDFKNSVGFYSGYPSFEDMQGSESEKKRWEANRKVAYLSSGRHFFRSVMSNTADKEGFIVYKQIDDPVLLESIMLEKKTPARFPMMYRKADSVKAYATVKVPDINTLFSNDNKDFKTFRTERKIVGKDTLDKESLIIIYIGQPEPDLFTHFGKPIKVPIKLPYEHQVSQLQLYTNEIMIDNNGVLTPDRGYKYNGYWAWQRIGDLTPFDYFGE